MKSRRAKILFGLILLGYLVTWLGAPPLARRACTARANQLYTEAVADEERQRDMIKELGDDTIILGLIANPAGPSVRFGPAIPILPGVLLLDNSYHIGPLYARGQRTFFLFYGFGVLRLFEVRTWIS